MLLGKKEDSATTHTTSSTDAYICKTKSILSIGTGAIFLKICFLRLEFYCHSMRSKQLAAALSFFNISCGALAMLHCTHTLWSCRRDAKICFVRLASFLGTTPHYGGPKMPDIKR
jgi:hypothetical protein